MPYPPPGETRRTDLVTSGLKHSCVDLTIQEIGELFIKRTLLVSLRSAQPGITPGGN